MGNTFARLFPFTRRGSRGGSSAAGHAANGSEAAADDDAIAGDDAPHAATRAELDAPPVLRPSAIFRQLLYDPAEITPVWARPRSAAPSEPATALATAPDLTVGEPGGTAIADVDEPKPAKRTRRPKADASATTTAPARPRPKRSTRKDPGADGR